MGEDDIGTWRGMQKPNHRSYIRNLCFVVQTVGSSDGFKTGEFSWLDLHFWKNIYITEKTWIPSSSTRHSLVIKTPETKPPDIHLYRVRPWALGSTPVGPPPEWGGIPILGSIRRNWNWNKTYSEKLITLFIYLFFLASVHLKERCPKRLPHCSGHFWNFSFRTALKASLGATQIILISLWLHFNIFFIPK